VHLTLRGFTAASNLSRVVALKGLLYRGLGHRNDTSNSF